MSLARQAAASALAATLLLAGAACAQSRPPDPSGQPQPVAPRDQPPDVSDAHVTFLPTSVSQGALVVGLADPDAVVEYAGRSLRVSPRGRFVFGVGRNAQGPLTVRITPPDGAALVQEIAVTRRDWPLERVNGVPSRTVDPPKAVADRIARERAEVATARTRDDARAGFAQDFIWPVRGRISGRFGNQRIYNGTPGSAHSGMDIAVAKGTPVKAPAAGVVTMAKDLYITGGTILLDHGHGVSSNFLHLSRLDVEVGDRVERGEVIGAVGASGRATGPHLHWGMNWFDVRVDPLLVLGGEP